MKLIDLSQPLTNRGPHCPVHPPLQIEIAARHPADGWHMEHLSMASHSGSHLDAPLHKIAGGKAIDDFPLESFAGPAWIVDLRGIPADAAISAAQLAERLPEEIADGIILLATGWGNRRADSEEWNHHSPYLSPAGAEWLVNRGIRAVGIDHYSIGGSREPDNARTHEILLGADKWIVEDLFFPDAVFALPRPLSFWALPINFPGFSGSFCRPVAAVVP